MGDLLLCNEPLAAMPYYMEGIGINVYSLEELNYYILNNTLLIDRDFMSEELCDWIESEQQQPKLADALRQIIRTSSRITLFVSEILNFCAYCTAKEITEIMELLSQLEEKSDFECCKLRADKLMEKEKYLGSIYEYKRLLGMKDDSNENRKLRGDIYHNLATAYARLFLFDTAVKYFEKAYNRNGDRRSIWACLYACRCKNDARLFDSISKKYAVSNEEVEQLDGVLLHVKQSDLMRDALKRSQNIIEHEQINAEILRCKEEYREINAI